MAIPHSNGEDTVLRGYTIPKGTVIIPNLHSVHWDSDLWPDPEKFDPGRFLDAEGKYRKRDELIAFGLGMFMTVLSCADLDQLALNHVLSCDQLTLNPSSSAHNKPQLSPLGLPTIKPSGSTHTKVMDLYVDISLPTHYIPIVHIMFAF
jgi:hypothetical protein